MLEVNYYMVKKSYAATNAYVFRQDRVGVKKIDIPLAKIKLIKGFKILPEEFLTDQYILRLLQHSNCGPGHTYKICPIYRKKSGVHRPILAIKLFRDRAEIYEPVQDRFEEWVHRRNVIF